MMTTRYLQQMKNKNQSRLSLSDLLRRRKMTLGQFVAEFGITTHEMIVIHCDRMGVNAPSDIEIKKVLGPTQVSSPTEGVIVLEAPTVTQEDVEVKLPTTIHVQESNFKLKRRKKVESTED